MFFSNKSGIIIVHAIIKSIQKNKDWLSEIDSANGDGDHGINMNKGFTLAEQEITTEQNMSEGLLIISQILMNKIGGSMGPLYGSFFQALSVVSRDEIQIDKAVILRMLEKARANLARLTPARPGDKTLIDVLEPALIAWRQQVEANASLTECLEALRHASAQGLESTQNMVARLGRGSRLRERSLGHADAGAASCDLILQAFADGVQQLIARQES